MSARSGASRARRGPIGWLAALVASGAFYLLLIDITDLAELLVLAAAALLASAGFALARERGRPSRRLGPSVLLRVPRPLLRAPADVAVVAAAAITQLVRPRAARGGFREVPFPAGMHPGEAPRRALAEALGSFAPNTVIVGVDEERGVIVAHQLCPRGGEHAVDVMGLG